MIMTIKIMIIIIIIIADTTTSDEDDDDDNDDANKVVHVLVYIFLCSKDDSDF